MFFPYEVKDCFGKFYVVCIPGKASISADLMPIKFSDLNSTSRFLQNLVVHENYWKQLIIHISGNTPYVYGKSVFNDVCQLLVRGRIKIYKVPHENSMSHLADSHTFKPSVGRAFKIVPATALLTERPANTKTFVNAEEVMLFIKNAKADEKQLQSVVDLVKETPINEKPANKAQINKAAVNIAPTKKVEIDGIEKLTVNLAEAIVAGKAIVIEVKSPVPPKTKVVEITQAIQPASLGPDVQKKWCDLTITEETLEGKILPVSARVDFIPPDGAKKAVVTGSTGTASISTAEESGTFDIKQVEILEKNVIFEFVSFE